MVTLNISVFLFLLFWSHSSPQMFHSQHQVEQSCSLIEQRILVILRAQILDVSIKEATSKVIKDILQTTVQHFQSSSQEITAKVDSLEGVIETLERRIPDSQETMRQNLQSSIQKITAKVDSQDESRETILQNLQSSIQEISAKVDSQDESRETILQNIQSSIQEISAKVVSQDESREIILQNFQSSIQEITAKVDSLEGMIATLKRRIHESQETMCKLLVSKLEPRPQIGIFEERCYFYGASQLNWTAAQETCQSAGGNLVTVSSLALQKFLERLIPQGYTVWIGGTDRLNEGSFVWIGNGVNFNDGFQYWDDGEPSNREGNEHCVEIRTPLLS